MLEAAVPIDTVRALADLGMLGAMLIGVGVAWWLLRRNGGNNGPTSKMLDVMKGREERIDRMLDELATQGRLLERMVIGEERTNETLKELIVRIDQYIFGRFGEK